VGTWIKASNTTVNFTIYDNFNGSSLSSVLGSTGNQLCTDPGYYTFNLSSPITINTGNDFYIRTKYTNTAENGLIPIEIQIGGSADPHIETGKYWTSWNGSNWTAIGNNTGDKFDLCIKAYGYIPGTIVETSSKETPGGFAFRQNYPNPFNPETTIEYQLPNSQHVVLKVYDTAGREVMTLVNEEQASGNYQIHFDAGDLPSGIYICHMTAGQYTQTMKLTLLK
jgi:hypothetical protein